LALVATAAAQTGIFEGHQDIGDTPAKGAAEYNAATKEYRVSGGGADMWAGTDAFQFAWKRITGDAALTADVRFAGEGAEPHRKAVLILRQDLTPSSAYVDVALHGDGTAAFQLRRTPGGTTENTWSPMKGAVRLRIERRGDQLTVALGKPGEALTPSGSVTLTLKDPVYLGIGVCSHRASLVETAIFSNVVVEPLR
jgi:TolB protein